MKNWQKMKIEESRIFQEIAYKEVNELVFIKRKGKELELDTGEKAIEFMSCGYLGLDMDARVIQAAGENLQTLGVTFPTARTRAKAKSFDTLEALLNKIFCGGNSTIFNSLHLGHLGFIPMLGSGELPSFPAKPNGFFFVLDKTVHASIQIHRALLQQFGEVVLIDFTQKQAVERAFQQAAKEDKTPVAIADSIGSMGGKAPVLELFQWADDYDGYVYLDDAHGTSIYGVHGCGYVLDQLGGIFHKRLILASSLAKAFGAVAGVIALPTPEDAAMMRKYSPTYIFGGPPPLSIIDSAIASARIHLTNEIYDLQKRLRENIDYFDTLLEGHVINSHTCSPVRGVFIGEEQKAIVFAKVLRSRAFLVTTAMYPTVKKKESMLRVAISAIHSKAQIKALCEHIKALLLAGVE